MSHTSPFFVCLLGSHPELSLAELQAVLGGSQVSQLTPTTAQFSTLPVGLSASELLNMLGGTRKILSVVASITGDADEAAIQTLLFEYLTGLPDSKLTFGVAAIDQQLNQLLDGLGLKRQLVQSGHPARMVRSGIAGVAAARLLHHPETIDLLLLKSAQQLLLLRTIAVQDIDDWTKRDRAKPYADHKKGMLPPKVARMMLNLGLRQSLAETAQPIKDQVLLDPFCGSGTILSEAALLGVGSVRGSDVDPQATAGTLKNLAWLQTEYGISVQADVQLADATHLAQLWPAGSVSVIVTEPFLGKQTPDKRHQADTLKGLHKLYLGSFRNWLPLLAPGARIVCIFPLYTQAWEFSQVHTRKLVDKLEALGYTSASEPLVYQRPQAVVARAIWQFTRK